MARRFCSNCCSSSELAPQWGADRTDIDYDRSRVSVQIRCFPGVASTELPGLYRVYEFPELLPDTLYTITVQGGNQSATLETRTLPSAVPTDLDRWLNVLLVSCFHQAEDRQGLAGIIVSQLQVVARPHLTLLAGDQAYLDLPTLEDFPDDVAWLASKFEQDYTSNWRWSARDIPESCRSPQSLHSRRPRILEQLSIFRIAFIGQQSDTGRARPLAPGGTSHVRRLPVAVSNATGRTGPIDIAPLLSSSPTRAALKTRTDALPYQVPRTSAWSSGCPRRSPTSSLRRSIFQGNRCSRERSAKLLAAAGDYEPPNYDDYGRILLRLQQLADAGRPALSSQATRHWGRVVTATDILNRQDRFH